MAKTGAPAARHDLDRRGRHSRLCPSAGPAPALQRAAPRVSGSWPMATISSPICCSSPASADAQHARRTVCPRPTCRSRMPCKRAREFGMPPLDRTRFAPDAVFDCDARARSWLWRLGIEMPEEAAAALGRVRAADAGDAGGHGPIRAGPCHSGRSAGRASLRRRRPAGAFRPAGGAASMPSRWCRSATAPARSAAVRRRPRWWSAGRARTARAIAAARCAARCGTMCASNARCAPRPRASPIRRSKAAPGR